MELAVVTRTGWGITRRMVRRVAGGLVGTLEEVHPTYTVGKRAAGHGKMPTPKHTVRV